MRLKQFLYIVPLAFLAACSSKDATTAEVPTPPTPWDPVNETIKLYAGIAEGGQQVVTRAGAEDNHGSHLAMTQGTKVAVRVSGTWTGHTPASVVNTPTGTVGAIAADTENKHNLLTLAPTITWDDYGTADPANANTGRTEGLTIYGVAIDGYKSGNDFALPSSLTSITNWEALSWTLNADQTSGENIPAQKDLLISNNVKAGTDDGTYKFTQRESGKLLEFRHALSKITVNLKAGTDFPDDPSSEDPEVHKFEGTPEVKLTSNEANATTNTEWAYLTGTVNITTGTVTSQGGNAAVTMNPTTPTTGWTKSYEALVMPGSEFTADNAIIVRINADGNIYYVSAEKIRAAIAAMPGFVSDADAYKTKSGKNYVLNITVNKTQINVTATVLDWVTVEAAEVAPKINITVNYSIPGTAVRVNTFSFYRSLSLNDGYATGESESLKIGDYYKRVSELTKNNDDTWTMNPQRYWSNHNQHYQFRLVWPNTTTALKDATENPDVTGETVVQKWRPHVEDKTYGETNYQVIEIWNDPFQEVVPSNTVIADNYHPYPSNLAIARPDVGENDECTNNEPGHTRTNLYSGGICATEGKINLTFRFVMSQVEVQLTTTSTSSSAVRLDEAKVELVNAYTHGYVMLGDRTVKPDGDKTTDELDFWKKETVGGTDTRFFRSAIVPQELTFSEAQASGNLKFKITITNGDGTKDVYYADVEPILKSDASGKVAPNGKWESGVRYVYHLNVSKTLIKATATLANWTTVEASEEVWF